MPNVLTMNDEAFLRDFDNLPGETPAAVVAGPSAEELAAQQAEADRLAAEQAAANDTAAADAEAARLQAEADAAAAAAAAGTGTGDGVNDGKDEATRAAEAAAAAAAVASPTTEEPPFDYKAAYESIVGQTYKYKGKEFVVKTADEAKQLVQKGVGFHGRMAQMAGDMRLIETLRENGLLEESKINELIDISKKNPEAIRALVQSAGLEPHQLIPQGDAQPYTPGNHVLPETQLAFRSTVAEISAEQGGQEFLAHVAKDWDVASRAAVFEEPSALSLIHGHKQNGIYDQIASEVERRKVLDASMAKMPFIHAYLAVGDELNKNGAFASQQEQPTPPAAPATPAAPVLVKPAVAPTQPVTPNPAAAKAASVRSTPTPASATPNYLTMSDDEFMKNHKPA